jgi:RHS repeat-associated protein
MNQRPSSVKLGAWLRFFLVIALTISSLPKAESVQASRSLITSPDILVESLHGDVDGDGDIDLDDARMVTRFVSGEIGSLSHPENADATQDGKITIEDALAIAQRVSGQSRIVMIRPEYGFPGKAYVGSVVRIEVYERFFPFFITGGSVRIQSSSTGYDSGNQPLSFMEGGRSLFYHWDTGGLLSATDYTVIVSLTESEELRNSQDFASLANMSQNTAGVSLISRSYEISYLAKIQDAFTPSLGIPLEFNRVFPQDSLHAPYLGPFGRGWMHNYDVHLEEYTDGRIAFLGAEGFNRWYTSNDDGTYTATPGVYNTLTRDPDGTFQIREKDGFLYHFKTDLHLDYLRDTNGNQINAIYNANNQLVQIQHSDGQSFFLEYNPQGRISKFIDQIGRETTFQYNAAGDHLLSVTAPGGRVTTYTYSLGQGEASDHRLLSIGFPDETHLYYTYDTQGRLISNEGDGGAGKITYSYEDDGTTHITNEAGGVTSFRVNERGQPVEIINPVGAITRFEYDSYANLARVTDPLNQSYSMNYDNWGNLTQITDPLNNTTKFGYESNYGKIASFLDSLGNTTTYSYDAEGNLTTIVYPDNSSEEYSYDEYGSLTSKKNRGDKTITYSHDAQGLLTSKSFPDANVTSYTYDIAGNLKSAENYTGVIRYEYDALDRVVRAIYPGERSFQYEYDAAGKRTHMTDPDGKIMQYEYDMAGRLARILDGLNQVIVAYQYNTANQRIKKTLGNGAYTTYEYDAAGQILHLVNHDDAGVVISRFDYTYDAAGNRLSKTSVEGIETYSYDALNQLIGVNYPDGSTTQYVYDAMGNRLSVIENDVSSTYTVNNLNQYTAVGNVVYGYDMNGNLVSMTEGGQTTYYDYDDENHLSGVRSPTETISYSYNAFGLLNSRSDAQATVRYLWDANQIAIEESETHTTSASYVWGNILDEGIQMERGGNNYYYAQDAMLSVTDLLNISGDGIAHYQYRAFGEPLAASTLDNPWHFTGLAFDVKTGMQYNRLRYYLPDLGRFTGPDPIHLAGGLNLYSYALNIPTYLSDPEGASTIFTTVVVIVVIIAVISGQIAAINAPFNATGPSYSDLAPGPAEDPYSVSRPVPATWPPGSGSVGGGSCPTFIQLPSDIAAVAISSTQLNVNQEKIAGKITVPIDGVLLRSDIPIFGVAGGTDFKEYRVEYGEGNSPTEWHLIASSTTPQPTTDVGLAQIKLMQGDMDIRGNLATWNTGLKNWVHLPWHPPEDPTDLNGVYSLRLVVIGKDGKSVEDRMTVEVGRAIAQALPGIAISPDQRVVMRFPEQSLTDPFRVFTILPLSDVGEELPPAPDGGQMVGPIYRIREPGDRFAKDVVLEFQTYESELSGNDIRYIGIARYDVEKQEWLWLPTRYAEGQGGASFTTTLSEIPVPEAIYALVFDTRNSQRSQPVAEGAVILDSLMPVSSDILIDEAFEKDTGTWKSRDRFVGGVIALNNESTPDGSFALKISNENYGGNFSVTVLDQPFDVREYPVMSFDYRISQGVKTDFYLRVGGRWYNLGFTDDPTNFRNRDVNIGNLGQIEGIFADDQWHSTRVNLYQLLRQKTRNTQVEAIMMADWDVAGYMKLDFGQNARAAAYYIDNFMIAANPLAKSSDSMMVDSYEASTPTNLLNGPTGTFSNPETNYCQADIVYDPAFQNPDQSKSENYRVLRLAFDALQPNAYCGYWTALMAANVEEMSELSFRLYAPEGVPPLWIGLRHAATSVEARVPLQPYINSPDANGWQTASIPTSAFLGRGLTDLTLMDVIFLTFENKIFSGQGTIYLDDIQFQQGLAHTLVADFDHYPMEYNLLGGGFRIVETGAAALSAGYHEDRQDSSTEPIGTVRISYGGTIGLDYGEGRFSYGIWETDLLGYDARVDRALVIKIKGQTGGEKPNIYLDDGITRRPVRAMELPPITTSWQEIYIPLEKFASQGVDLSHLEALQLDFEWEKMEGTIYIGEIRFSENIPAEAIFVSNQSVIDKPFPTASDQLVEETGVISDTGQLIAEPIIVEDPQPLLPSPTNTPNADPTKAVSTGSRNLFLPIGIGLLGITGLGVLLINKASRSKVNK